jgi:hypothetical protein
MGHRKILGRRHKAGTGHNKGRKRAQVAQHRCQAEDVRKSSEASPPPMLAAAYQCPPHVVSSPVMAAEKALQSLSCNKFVLGFDTIPSEPVNTANAFKYNDKGEERSDAAKRKAKSRASNCIVNAIQECGDNSNDRAAALTAALAHPDIQGITKNVVMVDPKTSEMMRNALNQQRRMI